LLWTCGSWRRRQSLFWGFLFTMALLFAGSELVVPHWIPKFFDAAFAYSGYTYSRSVLMLLFTRNGGLVVSAIAVIALAVFCVKFRRFEACSAEFYSCSALVFAATLVITPSLSPHGHVLLLPAMILLLSRWRKIWHAGPWQRRVLMTTAVLTAWPFACTIVLWMGALFDKSILNRYWLAPLAAIPLVPLAVSAALLIAKPLLASEELSDV